MNYTKYERELIDKINDGIIDPNKLIYHKNGTCIYPSNVIHLRNGAKVAPHYYRTKDGKIHRNNFDKNMKYIPHGYCLFKRIDGKLHGWDNYENDWNPNKVTIYSKPPKVGKGSFLIKTTKEYNDFRIIERDILHFYNEYLFEEI